MNLLCDDKGQFGPFEDLPAIFIVIVITTIFVPLLFKSYLLFEERKASIEYFSLTLQLADNLKTSRLLTYEDGFGHSYPQLMDYQKFNQQTKREDLYDILHETHGYPGYNYRFELVDCRLNTTFSFPPRTLEVPLGKSVVSLPVAIQYSEKEVNPALLIVTLWGV